MVVCVSIYVDSCIYIPIHSHAHTLTHRYELLGNISLLETFCLFIAGGGGWGGGGGLADLVLLREVRVR